MALKVAAILFALISFSCISLNIAINAVDNCDPAALEQISLDELVEKATISDYCFSVAADVFRSKFAQKSFTVTWEYIEFQYHTRIDGFEKVQNTLKYFGHLIHRIDFGWSHRACELHQNIEVLRSINQYCSKTLQSLSIHGEECELNIFNAITLPFEKIEYLSVGNSVAKLQTDNVKWNELFPQVKQMMLKFNFGVTDPEFINHQYLQLEELYVSNWLWKNDTEPIFQNIIKKNPQIKVLFVDEPTRTILKYVNEQLPDLETITIWHGVIENTVTDEIHFKNVRDFAFFGKQIPTNVTFEDLREITFFLNPVNHRIHNGTYNFVLKNPNLRKIEIFCDLSDSEVRGLAAKFSHLSEAFLQLDESVSAETVVHFVKTSEKLNKLTFQFEDLSYNKREEFARELIPQLGVDFNILPNVNFVIDRKIPV